MAFRFSRLSDLVLPGTVSCSTKYYFVDKFWLLTHALSSSSEDCVVHFWSSVRSWDGYLYFINTTLTVITQIFLQHWVPNRIIHMFTWRIEVMCHFIFHRLTFNVINRFSPIQFELKIWLQPPAVDEKVHWSTDPQEQMVEAHLKSRTLMTL